ncbi:MAG TPA: protein translocase subunit SecD [Gemmatimonadota bacterium]|nr:protein translocase subunit SecD [Gemmatimonadota bacterium]
MGTVRNRILIIIGIVLFCGWTLLPRSVPDPQDPTQEIRVSPISLGLDLAGGMHLAVEIYDPDGTLDDDARADAIDRTLTTIRNRIDEFGVREPTVQKSGDDRIIVELAGIDDPERAKAIVEKTAFLEFKLVRDDDDFRDALPRIDRAIVAVVPAEELGPSRVVSEEEAPGLDELLGGESDTLSDARDTLQDAGGAPVAAGDTLPGQEGEGEAEGDGADEAAQEVSRRPLTAMLLESGLPGMFLVPEQDFPTVERFLALDTVQALIPRNTELRWGARPTTVGEGSYRELYVLVEDPMLTGDRLADAGPVNRDPNTNVPTVPFETTRQGARIFERVTSRNVGRYMAIVLDGRVQSAPTINETLSRRAQITMGTASSLQEAQDLALVLRAGALPQPIQIVDERTVSPSLGQDSIDAGKLAFIIGILGVVALMIVYYRVAGAMAVAALGVYVLLVLGALAGLRATLTLPGIAGLILSIGMAVDANVLIFERIREETDAGKTPRTAVDNGFAHALSAIVDANLTTLITAAILYQFGTGPVRGFAVTLSIGIVASFFTALYVTRTFFMVYLERRSPAEPLSI